MARKNTKLRAKSRVATLAVALLAFAGLWYQARFVATWAGHDIWHMQLWGLATHFGVIAAALIAASFVWVVLRGRMMKPTWHAALVVWCVAGAIVDFVVFLRAVSSGGDAFFAHVILYRALPLAALLHWIALAPKTGLAARDLRRWMWLPAVFVPYAVIRGVTSGIWAYPFLNTRALEPARFAGDIAAFVLCFVVVGLAVLGMAHFRPQRARPSSSRR